MVWRVLCAHWISAGRGGGGLVAMNGPLHAVDMTLTSAIFAVLLSHKLTNDVHILIERVVWPLPVFKLLKLVRY